MSDGLGLIDVVVAQVALVERPAGGGLGRGVVVGAGERPKRAARWTAEELAFVRDQLGALGLVETARRLGRSVNAVKIKQVRGGLRPALRAEGWLTACQVARLLGVDGHTVVGWLDCGVLPGGEPAPTLGRLVRRVRVTTLKRWLTRPETWVYVRVERMRPGALRRLVELAQGRWGDVWWDLRQAADYHGCDTKDVLRYIHAGRLTGVQAWNQGGRQVQPGWSRWYVRRSEAMGLVVFRGRGSGHELVWSERADAFLRRGRAEGRTIRDLARMMRWPEKRVAYRLRLLRLEGGGGHAEARRARRRRGGGGVWCEEVWDGFENGV